MNPKNSWYTLTSEEILAKFPHDQFVVWLCHTAREILSISRHYRAWQWFFEELSSLAGTYLRATSTSEIETAFQIMGTNDKTDRPSERAIGLMPAGWSELWLLKNDSGVSLRFWHTTPHNHPVYLVQNFARACTAHRLFSTPQGRSEELAKLQQRIEEGVAKYRFERPTLLSDLTILGTPELANGLYCTRNYCFGHCTQPECPAQLLGTHGHLIPWNWAYWMEPELFLAPIFTKKEGHALLTSHFSEATLGKLSLSELHIGLEQSGLPE